MWQKHGAEILTAKVRAMRQQKRSKRTTSNSIGRFWNQISPIFPPQSPYIKSMFLTFVGADLEGGRSRFYKKLCTRVLLQNAVRDKSPPETRTSRIESVLCGWKELWTLIFWTWVKLDYETKRAGTWSNGILDTFRLWFVIACNRQKRVWQKHGAEILNCNRQSYGATKTI